MSENYASIKQGSVYASPIMKVGHNGNTIENSKQFYGTSKSYEQINKSNSNSKKYLDSKL